jgi:hypothetical protein
VFVMGNNSMLTCHWITESLKPLDITSRFPKARKVWHPCYNLHALPSQNKGCTPGILSRTTCNFGPFSRVRFKRHGCCLLLPSGCPTLFCKTMQPTNNHSQPLSLRFAAIVVHIWRLMEKKGFGYSPFYVLNPQYPPQQHLPPPATKGPAFLFGGTHFLQRYILLILSQVTLVFHDS